jgi:glycosyltransferase involved in cell wall biosynthesis
MQAIESGVTVASLADRTMHAELEPLPLPPLPSKPLVSVLVTNFNYAQFLPGSLGCLIAQTYGNWEAVVCDDGSTDGSADVVRSYAKIDARIRVVEKENGGQNAAMNAAFPHLRGEVICLLDSDDLFTPDKIERVVEAFAAKPLAGMCAHHSNVIDGNGTEVIEQLNHKLDSGWLAPTAHVRGGCVYVPTTSSLSFRKEVLAELMPIWTGRPNAGDADGHLTMLAQFLTHFVALDGRFSSYRVHGNNMGGLTAPTFDRMQYELKLIRERTDSMRKFVSNRFGQSLSEELRIQDNPQFIQAALKLHAISRTTDEKLVDVKTLIGLHPDSRWRTIWKCIFAMPRPLRTRALPMMHSSHRVKAAIQKRLVKSSARTKPSLQTTSVAH